MNSKINDHQIQEVLGFHLSDYLENLNGKEPSQVLRQVLDIVEPVVIEAMLDYTDDNQSKAAR